MAEDDTKRCSDGDELIAGPELPNGARPFIRHTASHDIESGIMRPVADGEPMYEGAFHLEPKDNGRYRVTDVFGKSEESRAKGPVRVSTPAYRENWDSIFGKRPVGQA